MPLLELIYGARGLGGQSFLRFPPGLEFGTEIRRRRNKDRYLGCTLKRYAVCIGSYLPSRGDDLGMCGKSQPPIRVIHQGVWMPEIARLHMNGASSFQQYVPGLWLGDGAGVLTAESNAP